MERLGQHFLKNGPAIKKIAAALDLRAGDTVIEVGAGHGELTDELKVEGEKFKVKIIAVEKDEKLADLLRERFSRSRNIEIAEGDVLKILPDLISNPKLSVHNYKIAGNIPYYITGKLLRIIGELKNKPELCVFTLQKEVAERISAKPPKMNRLAASVQFWAEAKIIGRLAKRDFEPPPEVESATIKLKVKSGGPKVDPKNYYATVKILFQQPRKTILNNLASNIRRQSPQASKEEIAEKFSGAKINPQDRPQCLTIPDIEKIAEALFF